MPTQGRDRSSGLSFTRRTLEGASCSLEDEHEGVNPHKYYRGLRTNLGRLRGHRDPPYEVVAQRARDLRFDPDAAGQRTGAFTARLQARSDTPALGAAIVEHRPWAPHGVGLVGLGLLVVAFGAVASPLFFLGAAIALLGVGLYSREAEGEIPLERRDLVSVIVEGEAHESTRQTATGRRCELSADMGVLYAGEVFLTIPTETIDELPWALRAELVNRRRRWKQALLEDPPVESEEGIATGVLDAVRAWTLLDGGWAKRQIESLQREVRGDLGVRQAHTELLSELRATDVRKRELERIDRELEALANEMKAYARRERGTPLVEASDNGADRTTKESGPILPARSYHREPPLRPREDGHLMAAARIHRAPPEEA